jgi:hypothetical protein
MVHIPATFTITLDLELYWGVCASTSLEGYREHLLGVRSVVPDLLTMFANYQIQATWSVVGFLFFGSRNELLANLPNKKPNYINKKYCTYSQVKNIGENENEDLFHYAPSLIKMIKETPGQEIGSHTFSHYYCLEAGQDCETFRADLDAAIRVANSWDLSVETLVFPKNQINQSYLPILSEKGIKAYRGNEISWFYTASSATKDSLLKRSMITLDTYLNLSGHNAYTQSFIKKSFPFNIPSSRFLRPYSKKLAKFEERRLARILSGLNYAAKNGLVYHLWWHPHNFGGDPQANLAFLRRILDYFREMQNKYAIKSLNMKGLAARLLRG